MSYSDIRDFLYQALNVYFGVKICFFFFICMHLVSSASEPSLKPSLDELQFLAPLHQLHFISHFAVRGWGFIASNFKRVWFPTFLVSERRESQVDTGGTTFPAVLVLTQETAPLMNPDFSSNSLTFHLKGSGPSLTFFNRLLHLYL